jgi:hypothetical protein
MYLPHISAPGARNAGWGKPSDSVGAEQYRVLDSHDPNYDSENDAADDYYFQEMDFQPEEKRAKKFAATLENMSKFKIQLQPAIDEYFSSFDSQEFLR